MMPQEKRQTTRERIEELKRQGYQPLPNGNWRRIDSEGRSHTWIHPDRLMAASLLGDNFDYSSVSPEGLGELVDDMREVREHYEAKDAAQETAAQSAPKPKRARKKPTKKADT